MPGFSFSAGVFQTKVQSVNSHYRESCEVEESYRITEASQGSNLHCHLLCSHTALSALSVLGKSV